MMASIVKRTVTFVPLGTINKTFHTLLRRHSQIGTLAGKSSKVVKIYRFPKVIYTKFSTQKMSQNAKRLGNNGANNNDGNDTGTGTSTDRGHGATSSTATCAELPDKVLAALQEIFCQGPILEYKLETKAIAGLGENSYGLLVQAKAIPTRTLPTFAPVPPVYAMVKMAPTNAARRAHMKVAQFYEREVFMYEKVLPAYQQLVEAADLPLSSFDIIPKMLFFSLTPNEEVIIFEDLSQSGYAQNPRTLEPTSEKVLASLQALGQLHAMSFVLRAKQPDKFREFISQLPDNLFSENIDTVSLEFGKKYVRNTRKLLEEEDDAKYENKQYLVHLLKRIQDEFEPLALRCANGYQVTPYSVICHGDFWNNNMLYKHHGNSTVAKLIDFQMSRYASPVLDMCHYIFLCTTQKMRDLHFKRWLDHYYEALTQHLSLFGLDVNSVYPREVFKQHLHDLGIYAFIMSSFAMPFYISQQQELPDFDEVGEAIRDLGTPSTTNDQGKGTARDSKKEHVAKARNLVDEYNLISERTLPIFKERMINNIVDLVKLDMLRMLKTE